jgi:thioredoxin-related protein
MVIGRRQFVKTVATSFAVATSRTHAKDTALPVPVSLAQAAQYAKSQGQPLVLLISLPGCVYCELVRRSYLMPLLADAGLQAWQLDSTNRSAPLLGFDGKSTTAAAQVKAWKATFTPTVMFFGSDGQELAERLVGIAVPDFYGAYLEQRLIEARRKL